MKEKRENQREKLVAAACELAAQSGIAALRTRDIAKKAGVSVGTLHYCFATKDELLQSLYEFIIDQFQNATEHLAGKDRSIREDLIGQARLRLHLLRSQDTVYLAWRAFTREAWTEPSVAHIMRAHYAEQRARFEKILARGRKDGSLPPEPLIPDSITAALIVSFYEGLTVQWSMDRDKIDPEEFVAGLHKLLGWKTPEVEA
jgi:AcrR family transcriptional regulator